MTASVIIMSRASAVVIVLAACALECTGAVSDFAAPHEPPPGALCGPWKTPEAPLSRYNAMPSGELQGCWCENCRRLEYDDAGAPLGCCL